MYDVRCTMYASPELEADFIRLVYIVHLTSYTVSGFFWKMYFRHHTPRTATTIGLDSYKG
jgi:hypothetical protein